MDHLNYQHLFYFKTVCDEGSFTKAGQKLRLSQSSISQQIKQLEDAFGQQLLQRSTRKIEITEAGRIALRYAEGIFSGGAELMDIMKHRPSEKRHMLRIGALGGLSRNLQAAFLEPILERDDVLFQVTTGDSKRLLKLLQEHSIDLVLSSHPAIADESQLYTHLLAESSLCVVCRPTLRMAKDLKIEEVLETYPVYIPSTNFESRSDFDHFVESRAIRLNLKAEIDDVALLRRLAFSSRGVVVVPKIGVITDIEKKNLKLLHQYKNISQKFYAITRQKKFPNPIIAELVNRLVAQGHSGKKA